MARTDALKPVMLVVEDESGARARIRSELEQRYGADYHVTCQSSAAAGLEKLERCRAAGADVALVLADQWMPDQTGEELLAKAKALHPHAKRAMLIEWGGWGDRETADAMLRAMALGRMDYYVLKPWHARDEFFHRTITEFLHEWQRSTRYDPQEIVIVGRRWTERSHELRSLLARNGVPHAFHASDSEAGRAVLADVGLEDTPEPVAVMLDGKVLVDPSNAELAVAYGVNTELPEDADFDVAIVGAGPAGLAAAVYASSEGLRTLVVEGESIGGQAGASSLIRNYLGFSRGVSGAELAQRAYQQAWTFGANFILMREVVALEQDIDRHVLRISDGSEARARAIVLACGIAYRRLAVPELEPYSGTCVFYGAPVSEATAMAGSRVCVVGGGNSAGQAAMHLCKYAEQVTMVVRGPTLGQSMSSYLCREIEAAENVDVRTGCEVVGAAGDEFLRRLTIRAGGDGRTEELPAEALFVLIGAEPRTGRLPDEVERDPWGYVLTGSDLRDWPLTRPPQMLETSLPGVFAVGDMREGSIKRVASAVGEGSVVIQQVHQHLEREAERLGLDSGAGDR